MDDNNDDSRHHFTSEIDEDCDDSCASKMVSDISDSPETSAFKVSLSIEEIGVSLIAETGSRCKEVSYIYARKILASFEEKHSKQEYALSIKFA